MKSGGEQDQGQVMALRERGRNSRLKKAYLATGAEEMTQRQGVRECRLEVNRSRRQGLSRL